MGVYLNLSHGFCRVYDRRRIPTFVVPHDTIVVLMQNRYEDDPLVRQNRAMLGEITRTPSALRSYFLVPQPASVRQDIMRLMNDKSFQLAVLERSHHIGHANGSAYDKYQFKTFPAGTEAPDLFLFPSDANPEMQGMDVLDVTNRSHPISLLTNEIRRTGYTLQQLVSHGRNMDTPKGQLTIVFSFSCQKYLPSVVNTKKRNWRNAFMNKVDGKTFEELFIKSNRLQKDDDSTYNQNRPVKTRRVGSSSASRITTRKGGLSNKKPGPSLNMVGLRQNILSNMIRDMRIE